MSLEEYGEVSKAEGTTAWITVGEEHWRKAVCLSQLPRTKIITQKPYSLKYCLVH